MGLGAKFLVRKLAGENLATKIVAWWIGTEKRNLNNTSSEGRSRSSENDDDRRQRVKEIENQQRREIDNAVCVAVKWLGQ